MQSKTMRIWMITYEKMLKIEGVPPQVKVRDPQFIDYLIDELIRLHELQGVGKDATKPANQSID